MSRKLGKSLAMAVAAGGLTSLASAQINLNTLYATNNSGNTGNIVFFDVTVGASPVTITGFDVNTLGPVGTVFGCRVWTHTGTWVGTGTTAGAWTEVSTGVGIAAASNAHSVVTLNNSFQLAAGTTYAFGISLPVTVVPTVAVTHAYTNGTGANQNYADANISIALGGAANVPFAATAPFSPRVWNGTIRYDLGLGATGSCCLANPYMTCITTTSLGCSSQGGTNFQAGVSCASAGCAPPPSGACCLRNGDCTFVTQVDCTIALGTWQNGVQCVNANCPPGGACCFYLANACQKLTQAACTTADGVWTNAATLCANANCPLPPNGGSVYMVHINNAARPIINFPVNAPAYNVIIPGITPVIQTFAIDFNGASNTLYCITNAAVGAQALGTIDVATGAYAQIALITGAGAAEANWAGLTFDNSTGTMYALAASNLYTVNLTTGVTTLVAPITGLAGGLLIDFSINNAGTVMVGHDLTSDRMFTINKATGVAAPMGVGTGFSANFAQGMDFDPVSGNLFAGIFTGASAGAFCKVNLTNGACQILTNMGPWAPANGPETEMAIKGTAPVTCYADCDNVGGLTGNDFQCFLNAFVANLAYADCDGVGGLTGNDFQCFLDKYVAGCS